ncbi:MAG: DUF2255 family protein [Candidatus Limnocylindrales bacterium]
MRRLGSPDTIDMMECFTSEALDLLRLTAEVEIETRMAAGEPEHRAVIWVVVDEEDRVLIRSYLGAKARWYREALASRTAVIIAGELRIGVRVDPAADGERITACSRALQAKYPRHGSTQAMLRQEILDTTLELLPAEPEAPVESDGGDRSASHGHAWCRRSG